MKQITRNLDNERDLSFCVNTLRSVLNNKTCNVEMILRERKETRRMAQNALQWHWYQELQEQDGVHGMELQELINYNKFTFGLKILLKSNPEFAEKIKQFSTLEYENKVALMEFMPVTSLMKVGEMAEYLTAFKLHWSKQGVVLTDKDDLMNKALG